jgi:drug/metabolite transporter (DMT)-like permease
MDSEVGRWKDRARPILFAMNSERSSLKDRGVAPHLALIAVQAMFGTWFVVGKVVLYAISSTTLVAFRVGGAAIALTLLQRRLGQFRLIPKRDLAWLTVCSLLGIAINQLLFAKGLSLTTAIDATLISTTIPVFTLAVSIALGYDRLSLRRSVGILLAAGGVVYLVDPLRANFSAQTTLGNLLIVINSLSYAVYIVLSKDLFKRYGALNVITWLFLISCIVTLPFGIVGLRGDHLQTLGAGLWLRVAYIVLVPTIAAYYLNAWALTRVSPSTVATYIYLQPLIAFGLAPIFLGERPTVRTLIACALIFAGVAVVSRRTRSEMISEVTEHSV